MLHLWRFLLRLKCFHFSLYYSLSHILIKSNINLEVVTLYVKKTRHYAPIPKVHSSVVSHVRGNSYVGFENLRN